MKTISELQLLAMESVETYSKRLKTLSWVWGGFTIDIYANGLLREHDDIDYLTLNLHKLLPQFSEWFGACGWEVKVLENDDLSLKRDGVKIHVGHVEISEKARWTHNGEKGSIWFPPRWLKDKPAKLCGIEVHVVEPEFQYVMLEYPALLNPAWKRREKDMAALAYLKRLMESHAIIETQTLIHQVYDAEP